MTPPSPTPPPASVPPTTGQHPGAATSPPPAPPPRLARLRRGRLLGGVAAGIAAHLEVDPVLVRVGFVILGLVPFPGFGLLLYLALLVVLPIRDDAPSTATPRAEGRGPGFYVGVALVALGGIWVLGIGAFGLTNNGGGQLFPLLLIGLGVALWVDADRRDDREVHAASDASSVPPPDTEPVADPAAAPVARTPPTAPAGEVSAGTVPGTPPTTAARERSVLGQVTVGIALLAAGVVWLLGQLAVIDGSATRTLATSLAVLGVGLLVGSVVGRARWLLWLAVPLAMATLTTAVVAGLGLPLDAGFDDRRVAVTTTDQLDAPFELAIGSLRIDLTGLDPDGQDPVGSGARPVLAAAIGGGELVVTVPEGAGLSGSARVQAGALVLLGEDGGGIMVERLVDVPAEPGQPTYELDLLVGVGELRITRGPAEAVPDVAGSWGPAGATGPGDAALTSSSRNRVRSPR